MSNTEQDHELLHAQGDAHLIPGAPSAPSGSAPRMGLVQKIFGAILLSVVLLAPAAGFYSYFSGIPLHLLASAKDDKDQEQNSESPASRGVSLVSGGTHTLEVPEEVRTTLGIRKGDHDSVVVAQPPTTMRPIVLSGSTRFDPARLDRIRARFAPARVVQLAQVQDRSPKTGFTEYRDIRPGDTVAKGDLLAVFYSVDVGSKKNDLLDALVQEELDQKILDAAQKHGEAVPAVFMLTYERAVQGDRNAINRALNNLRLWDIPQDEIDALHAEAKKISADKNAWLKTPEGLWVKGEKQATGKMVFPHNDKENPWGRVTLRADRDGVVVESNLEMGEMVVDNTVNLFQIADVSRLQVVANCPEDALPALEALDHRERKWAIRTVSAPADEGLPGTIDEIGYMIDPNQHTAVIKGYVVNPGKRIRAGQYVTATVKVPPPDDVVEIPTDALLEDGLQSVVFMQPDAALHKFTMRRVQVTHRFERSVFVRSSSIPKDEQLTAREADEGLLPKEPLRAGERVLLSGAVELKAALLELESRPQTKPADKVARGRVPSVPGLEPPPETKPKAGKG
jgi:cobalt-zinc-cadmium efflux system membrane fusion protein